MSKILFAAVAAALLAGPALAETESMRINTNRVDFNDATQVRTVYDKINDAARRVCTPPSDNRYVAQPEKDCMDRAVAQAVLQTNKPLLTQAYNDATGGLQPERALAGNDQ